MTEFENRAVLLTATRILEPASFFFRGILLLQRSCNVTLHAVSPMLFNFALEYAIRRVQVNQDGLKLNGTHQLLAYADDVNILGGSIHILKENAEALVATTGEIGLEVSADKTKCMVMSRDQNAGRIQSVRIDNSTFERVEEFKYLGTNLTNQNSIPEEIKSRLRSGNACYHSV